MQSINWQLSIFSLVVNTVCDNTNNDDNNNVTFTDWSTFTNWMCFEHIFVFLGEYCKILILQCPGWQVLSFICALLEQIVLFFFFPHLYLTAHCLWSVLTAALPLPCPTNTHARKKQTLLRKCSTGGLSHKAGLLILLVIWVKPNTTLFTSVHVPHQIWSG